MAARRTEFQHKPATDNPTEFVALRPGQTRTPDAEAMVARGAEVRDSPKKQAQTSLATSQAAVKAGDALTKSHTTQS